MNSFNEESLRKLSYSALKKKARKSGIKVNMTADKIIASLLEKSNADEDSFVTLERTILNSCKKNKEALFDADSKRMSETPRRDTYIVDTPSTNTKIINNSIVMASASPELKESKDESLNVTLNRGSEKKIQKSKRKVSFVTPLRRSTRFSAATPQYNSVKGRPKTPIPSRLSSSKRQPVVDERNDSLALNLNLDISESSDTKKSSDGKLKRPSTPMPSKQNKKRRLSSFEKKQNMNSEMSPIVILHRLKEEDLKEIAAISESDIKVNEANTPSVTQRKDEDTPVQSSKKIATSTPGFKKIVTPLPASSKLNAVFSKNASKRGIEVNEANTTLSATRKKVEATPVPSSKKIATSTPGFKKIVTPIPASSKLNNVYSTPKNQMKTPVSQSSSKSGFRTPYSSSISKDKIKSLLRKAYPTGISYSPTVIRAVQAGIVPNISERTLSAIKKAPNFTKIHQKALDKLESIADYNKRKLQYSEKKVEEQIKILMAVKASASKPKRTSLGKLKKAQKLFRGIPFIPSAATTKPMTPNLKSRLEMRKALPVQSKALSGRNLAKKAISGKVQSIKKVSVENTPLKQRNKFDLRASLARKLPYKPHSGPLKPLNEMNLNKTISRTPLPAAQKIETKNQVVTRARGQARDILQGVRKNKRFMLQMNNRNLDVSQQ